MTLDPVAEFHKVIGSPGVDLARLGPLMERTEGRPEVVIGLLDGPVAIQHPALATHDFAGSTAHQLTATALAAPPARHGTFIAGVLSAQRDSGAPGLCPAVRCCCTPFSPRRHRSQVASFRFRAPPLGSSRPEFLPALAQVHAC